MPKSSFSFELIAQDEGARLGRISTSRGIIDTPAFMPVGTQGTVKGVYPDDIVKTDSQISPLSGSIKKQKVKYLGDEVFDFFGKKIKFAYL